MKDLHSVARHVVACCLCLVTTLLLVECGESVSDQNKERTAFAVGVVSGGAGVVEDTQMPSANTEDTIYFKDTSYEIPYAWTKKVSCCVSDKYRGETLVYRSSNKKIAAVDQDGVVTGVSKGKAVITVSIKEHPDITASFIANVKKERAGLHKTEDGKLYCVKKDGERAFGYYKTGGNYYYFNKKSYAVAEKWKYVTLDGRTYKLYFAKNGRQKQNVSALIGKQESYKLEVNISKNTVIVYAKDGKKGYRIPVKAMVCSCGIKGHATRTGKFSHIYQVGKWHSLYYGTYGKYCTRFSGPYLFHSVVYSRYGDDCSLIASEHKKLGELASHGCVRLQVKDAKWIYQNAGKCEVSIFHSNKKQPLKKPVAQKVAYDDKGNAYDATDTDVKVRGQK